MNYFNYLFQSYKAAYKKSRHWFSILYAFLLIEIWIQISIPVSGLLTLAPQVEWISKFSRYIENSFQPDSANAKSILISNLFKNKLRYTLEPGFNKPPDTNSTYFKTISNVRDSLLSYQLVDPKISHDFFKSLFILVQDSVISFRKEHIRRDDSLKSTQKKITEKLTQQRWALLRKNRNEFQKELNNAMDFKYSNILEPQILTKLADKLEAFSSDTMITVKTLYDARRKNYERKEILNTNILKNPYIDLPLKAQLFFIIILIVSITVYLYFSILIKYFTKQESILEDYNIPETIQVPSFKNITETLKFFTFSEKLSKIIGFVFYSLLPFIVIGFYSNFLFSIETIIIMPIIFIAKVFIWIRIDHPSYMKEIKKIFKKSY